MDMIGRLRGDRLHVWGVESGDRLEAIVQEAAEGRGLRLLTSGPGFGPSDQSSFYRARIPVLCFNTGVHGDLHAPSDTADKINAEGAVRVLGLVEAVVDALRSGEARVAYAPPKPGRRAFLGIQPDLDADDVAGCRLAEVVPGGPSAKAGLRAGDVVVAWEGKEIAGPQDLIVYLRHSQPGDQVALKVRRDGKTLDVTILLGNR
jgi:membrane-associated protease RseP (regulator of RpoE activity)